MYWSWNVLQAHKKSLQRTVTHNVSGCSATEGRIAKIRPRHVANVTLAAQCRATVGPLALICRRDR